MNDGPSDTPVGPSLRQVPEGDDRERLVCPDCGFIDYRNPKVVTGAVCVWQHRGQERVLLCKRAIEPRLGWWTIPAGFLEERETMAEGAVREVWEEARAEVEITAVIGFYQVPRISQIYVIHAARMVSGDHDPGPESAETALLPWDAIPWDDLAFPSVRWGLEQARGDTARFPLMAVHDR